MNRRWQAGQTTTEYLMISGLMTVIAIFFLKFVFSPSALGVACQTQSTIQCILQTVADRIINDPDDEASP
jgi:hypothetical protein